MTKPSNIKATWIDRGLEWIAPGYASQRYAARLRLSAVKAAYTGASRDRRSLSSWQTGGGDADTDINTDLPMLRERSRDLVQNNPLAHGAIETKMVNVIATGLRLRPQIDHDLLGLSEDSANEWERTTRREFALWANSLDCALDREGSFYDTQRLVYSSVATNGDALLSMPYRERPGSPYGLRLQIIEADRLCNPNYAADTDTLIAGVEKDADGATIRYHVANRHPGRRIGTAPRTWFTLPAYGTNGLRQVRLLRRADRPMQTRGVPDLAAVIEPFKQLGRYTDAELMAAVVSGMFTVFVRDTSGADAVLDQFQGNDNASTSARTDGAVELGNGAVIGLGPGQDVSFANPGRPASGFDPFVTAILRQIGVGLGLPYELLVKQFTTSYTAARAALLQAWALFHVERQWFAAHMCQPVYERWLYEAVLRGRIAAPGFVDGDPSIRAAWCNAEWIGTPPPILDEGKAVDAAIKRIDNHLSTRDAETLSLTGGDYNSDHRQRLNESRQESELATAMGPADPDDTLPALIMETSDDAE